MSLARLVITAVTVAARSKSAVARIICGVYASVSPRPATPRLMRTRGGKFSCLLRHPVATFCLDSPLEDV
jgi:hypothetical protein